MIRLMNEHRPTLPQNHQKKVPSLWLAIVLAILLACGAVILFGAFIYVFSNGAEQLGFSTPGILVVFVIISGIFAWLVKRFSDAASDLSRVWFPEDFNEPD